MMKHMITCTAAILLWTHCGVAAWAHDDQQTEAADKRVVFALEELSLPAVLLKDQDGRAVNLRELTAGKQVVITFQYATCQSQCPAANVIMQAMQASINGAKDKEHILLLSVTLDPEADTPEILAQKAAEFGAGAQWRWLTGETQDMREVYRSLGVPAVAKESHDVFFLTGDVDSGRFQRTSQLPSPDQLLNALAALR